MKSAKWTKHIESLEICIERSSLCGRYRDALIDSAKVLRAIVATDTNDEWEHCLTAARAWESLSYLQQVALAKDFMRERALARAAMDK